VDEGTKKAIQKRKRDKAEEFKKWLMKKKKSFHFYLHFFQLKYMYFLSTFKAKKK
jgi:hypothetical protein